MEAAPWQGGFFERLVGSVKRILRKTVLNAKLAHNELYTVLLEIEVAINNRPITHLYTEPGMEPLTPNHLLFGRKINTYAKGEEIPSFSELTTETVKIQTRKVRNVLENFWKQWRHEYLMDLRDFHIKQGSKKNGKTVTVGDIVILHEDDLKNSWKLARVDKLIESRDKQLRGVRLLISHEKKNVYINRPVNKITKLEVLEEHTEEQTREPAIVFVDDTNVVKDFVVAYKSTTGGVSRVNIPLLLC